MIKFVKSKIENSPGGIQAVTSSMLSPPSNPTHHLPYSPLLLIILQCAPISLSLNPQLLRSYPCPSLTLLSPNYMPSPASTTLPAKSLIKCSNIKINKDHIFFVQFAVPASGPASEEADSLSGAAVTIGEVLEAAASDKPVDQFDAAAIQVAEARVTGLGITVPSGIAVEALEAAKSNTKVESDEKEGDATTKLKEKPKILFQYFMFLTKIKRGRRSEEGDGEHMRVGKDEFREI